MILLKIITEEVGNGYDPTSLLLIKLFILFSKDQAQSKHRSGHFYRGWFG
ncbi:protein of unknown function [Paenibacillus alvei]|uniref:Uncharacterized protein n=1 Tax=Paenibacillus alvei TaxID=44250 RepID=A0A383RCP5_PAEAL|nr:protein of unknown function [Paenibacillus alvei]